LKREREREILRILQLDKEIRDKRGGIEIMQVEREREGETREAEK